MRATKNKIKSGILIFNICSLIETKKIVPIGMANMIEKNIG